MNPKDKARELVNKLFLNGLGGRTLTARDYALICVDVILTSPSEGYDYWNKVKAELENL